MTDDAMAPRLSDAVPTLVQGAVEAVIEGDFGGARSQLETIDFGGLVRERDEAFQRLELRGFVRDKSLDPELEERKGPQEPEKRALFERDSFTCWFCGKATLYAPVLAALGAKFDDLLPYKTGWWPVEEHILYWISSLIRTPSSPRLMRHSRDNMEVVVLHHSPRRPTNRSPASMQGDQESTHPARRTEGPS